MQREGNLKSHQPGREKKEEVAVLLSRWGKMDIAYFFFHKIEKYVFDYDRGSGQQTSPRTEKETGYEIVISHQTSPSDTANR